MLLKIGGTSLGQREIPRFNEWLKGVFTVSEVDQWQAQIFEYPWSRLYTTNIDNVLSVAHEVAKRRGKVSGDFAIFNFCDPSPFSETLGRIPVVSIHGSCEELEKGYIFSGIEYGQVNARVLDWHRELAARVISGGLVVIGSQLDESDIDTYVAMRVRDYGENRGGRPRNWIVMPSPDPIKAENYIASGFWVVETSAKEFFSALYERLAPLSVLDVALRENPSLRRESITRQAAVWMRTAFRPVGTEIEDSRKRHGVLKRFLSGDDPEWFYVTNGAAAETTRSTDLMARIGSILHESAVGASILHVVGPRGSGKTTAIRLALSKTIDQVPQIYEFNGASALDPDLLLRVCSGFRDRSIFVFYSASEYYYAISYVVDSLKDRGHPHCVFVLEDRLSDYRSDAHQIRKTARVHVHEVSALGEPDARSLVRKMEELGLHYAGFSDRSEDRRTEILTNKERGFGGDLLSALFSITSDAGFEDKINDDYFALRSPASRELLEIVAIVTANGFPLPLDYLLGMTTIPSEHTLRLLDSELAGVISLDQHSSLVRCRHRVVAEHYLSQCISKNGSKTLIVSMLTFLGRQFSVEDIRSHPLPYRIYKALIGLDFLYNKYFARDRRNEDTAFVYSECQKVFARDGIFWLQFGLFYREIGDLDNAIECLRTGLQRYDSFQTKHALGQTLLQKYLQLEGADHGLYDEGVRLLEAERQRRGDRDPYPCCTLMECLLRILEVEPDNSDAIVRLKRCANDALKMFRGDQYAEQLVRRAMLK